MTSLYEVLKAQKMGAAIAPDYFTALWAGATGGEQWEVLEYTGAVPVEITANGEPLLDYLISGNMQQTGTPTPESPITPSECGERTGNILDFNELKTAPSGVIPGGAAFTFDHLLAIEAAPNTTYTMSATGTGAEYGDANVNRSLYFGSVDNSRTVFSGHDVTYTTSSDGMLYVGFISSRDNAQQYLNGTAVTAINTGSTALPYEPYGYKLDISSGGENLLDESTSSDADTTHINYNKNAPILLTAGQTYTFSCAVTCSGLYIRSAADDSILASANNSSTLTYTPQVNVKAYCRVWNSNGITNLKPMLNLGSTAKPYSPYNRTTTPIYLGEVETTRQVKKLVLTGDEGWQRTSNGAYYLGAENCPNDYKKTLSESIVMCTHYVGQISTTGSAAVQDNNISFYGDSRAIYEMYIGARSISTLDAFKSYLAAQYAAGTPVTVWYVLATETTGILNEPLRKIGDYADTVSMEQAQVQIPTVSGVNVVDVETTLKPSEIYIKYKGRSES